MQYPRRSHSTNDKSLENIWKRAFPVQHINRWMLETLSETDALPDFQRITVAKFILKEIIFLQGFHKKCTAEGQEDCKRETELVRYVNIFEKLVDKIVKDTSPEDADLRNEFIESLWKQKEDGDVDFNGTRIPQILLGSVKEERLEKLLLDSLDLYVSEGRVESAEILRLCSPFVPSNFHRFMELLFTAFDQSNYHPKLLQYGNCIVGLLAEKYSSVDVVANLIPTKLRAVVTLSLALKQHCSKGTTDLKSYSREEIVLFLELLNSLLVDCKKGSVYQRQCKLRLFYVACVWRESCEATELARSKGMVTFVQVPWLWTWLNV